MSCLEFSVIPDLKIKCSFKCLCGFGIFSSLCAHDTFDTPRISNLLDIHDSMIGLIGRANQECFQIIDSSFVSLSAPLLDDKEHDRSDVRTLCKSKIIMDQLCPFKRLIPKTSLGLPHIPWRVTKTGPMGINIAAKSFP